MYTKILVAIDGSDAGNVALDAAIRQAKVENAQLFALYVIESPKFYLPDPAIDPTPVYDALIADSQRITQQVGDLFKKEGINGKVEVVDNFLGGKATADQIQHTADALHADLVVLGTHGRSGFKRLVLGSVAEAFIRMSTRPVLLIPQKTELGS